MDQRMIGAWSQSASDCAATFERRGGQIRFRQPVDEFKSAFIITPKGVETTTGRCSIARTSSDGKRTTFTMNCRNPVGYYDRTVKMSVQDKTLTYGFPGNEALDVKFEKCPL